MYFLDMTMRWFEMHIILSCVKIIVYLLSVPFRNKYLSLSTHNDTPGICDRRLLCLDTHPSISEVLNSLDIFSH